MRKDTCQDCACLVAGESDKWVCDEMGQEISDIKVCPYATAGETITFEIRWEDLTNECRESFMDLIGMEKKKSVVLETLGPLFVLEFEKEDN